MKSTYKLIWSDEAISGLRQIISYLENRFTKKDLQKFSTRLDAILKMIQFNPEAFPYVFKAKSIRRAVVAKLTSVYYKVDNDAVRILTIIDNRMDPDRLKF